ncbi:hypothetical protein FSP39_013169 [Pinctada imbricata]|uniref:Uncharacterized protein n=1 Tax=Pinctada imbricata TaxID=66713 RepID=A0AA89BZS2_PINIB|nr:hypothetical protein FSP39_013169 [Pinctada imbricata]
MPKYVLHYFDVRARGELIRLVLTVAGQDFEDHRFSFEEFAKFKPGYVSGQVPVLEVDGKQMNESLAIAKYVAREYGSYYGLKSNLGHFLYLLFCVLLKLRKLPASQAEKQTRLCGKTNLDQYYVDRVLGACTDLFTKYVEVFFAKDDATRSELQKKMGEEHIPRFLKLFSEYLKENTNGKSDFFVGNSGSIADLAVHDLLTSLIQKDEKLLDKYPTLKANRAATEALPNIKAYLDKRPKKDI